MKNILIFGCHSATSTIGQLAQYLHAQGHRIDIATKTLRDSHQPLKDHGIMMHQCNVVKESVVQTTIQTVLASRGTIDAVIVSVADSAWVTPSEAWNVESDALDDMHWFRSWHVNFLGAWHVIRNCRTALQQSQGHIVCMSSRASLEARSTTSYDYGTSKAALNHLVRLAAKDLAPQIKINAVAAGMIIHHKNLELWGEHASVKKITQYQEDAVLERTVDVQDLLSLIDWLINQRSMTGQILALDCGSGLG